MAKNREEKFVDDLKSELIRTGGVEAIILYGSFVSKKTNKSSDIDLIIFVRDNLYEKLIKELSKKVYNLFIKDKPNLFPSINIWKEKDSKTILPYYLTCLDLKNIRVIYDKINFNEMLETASRRLNKNYLRKRLLNEKKFWQDMTKESTKILSDFSLRKHNYLKKYADLALEKGDFDVVIELNYKSSYFLLTSFLESKGIHIKGKNDSYFLKELNEHKDLSLFLENYYLLLNMRKSTIPFNKNIGKKLALEARKIRIMLEKIYNKSLR